jgi:Amt family ammonium transporter
MTWMFYEWIKYGKPTALGAVTGMVAGLGTITPASGFVGPAGGLVIGIVAGIVCFNAVILIKQKWKIDDSLDVFPVHGVGGVLGTLMVAVFASSELGIFSGQGLAEGMTIMSQLEVQAIGIVATIVYTAIATYLILKVVGMITGLRVSAEEEQQGLDIISHEERGYDL